MTGFWRVRSRMLAGLLGVAVVVSPSSCVGDLAELLPTPGPTPSGHAGQLSGEQAVALIEQVPGTHSVVMNSGISGLSQETSVRLSVDDAAVVEQPAVLEFLFAVAWATTFGDTQPSSVLIFVYSEDSVGPVVPVELQPQANALFGSTAEPSEGFDSAYVEGVLLEKRWGPWPGAVPAVPVLASPAPG